MSLTHEDLLALQESVLPLPDQQPSLLARYGVPSLPNDTILQRYRELRNRPQISDRLMTGYLLFIHGGPDVRLTIGQHVYGLAAYYAGEPPPGPDETVERFRLTIKELERRLETCDFVGCPSAAAAQSAIVDQRLPLQPEFDRRLQLQTWSVIGEYHARMRERLYAGRQGAEDAYRAAVLRQQLSEQQGLIDDTVEYYSRIAPGLLEELTDDRP